MEGDADCRAKRPRERVYCPLRVAHSRLENSSAPPELGVSHNLHRLNINKKTTLASSRFSHEATIHLSSRFLLEATGGPNCLNLNGTARCDTTPYGIEAYGDEG